MSFSTFSSISSLIFLLTWVSCTKSLNYEDLISTRKHCPSRDKCSGYSGKLNYMDRNCECDSDCGSYKDCCIDAIGPVTMNPGTHKSMHKNNICLPSGHQKFVGVYMVTECSRNWTGSSQVHDKCIAPLDLSDPLNAAPMTSIQNKVSYRNIFCAQCNNENVDSLKYHQFLFECEGAHNVKQFLNDLTYNKVRGMWGFYRRNSEDNKFIGCQIFFEVPSYLHSSVRFCRSNVVSTCASNWTSSRMKCQEYMAVVYDRNNVAYRNPHCAICNHKATEDLFCTPSDMERFKPFSFTELIDVNAGQKNGQLCSLNQIYDPYFKRCKLKMCLKGYRLVNGRCVKD